MPKNSQQFVLNGEINDFKEAYEEINKVYCLLATMVGVDHAKTDLVTVSIAIETISELVWNAYEKLSLITIEEKNNA